MGSKSVYFLTPVISVVNPRKIKAPINHSKIPIHFLIETVSILIIGQQNDFWKAYFYLWPEYHNVQIMIEGPQINKIVPLSSIYYLDKNHIMES